MKKSITLGKGFKVDLPALMETRLLISANSGGGKSWALRRLLEQTHGQVQQIVIDLEGEFYTLREKYDDYILIGKDGDMPAHVRASALLAHKLLELGASAIIDLSELKFHERKHFVHLFLDSLIEAPEEIRRQCMVVIDEAHHFCPQVGESEATGSVIDLMTRGRKRGLCGVLATQRVSKLHKDAIAECNNKMFGRTAQDIDVKRTNDELGFTKSKKEAFETLRNLKAGEFFAFGTAIGSNVEKYKVGGVETTHFRRGKRTGRKTTPPKSAIKKMLKKLSDLPREAEKKLKNEKELRQEIGTLKATITRLENSKETPAIDEKEVKQIITQAKQEAGLEWEKVVKKWQNYAKALRGVLSAIGIALEGTQKVGDEPETKPDHWLTPSNLEPVPKKLLRDMHTPQAVREVDQKRSQVLKHSAKVEYADEDVNLKAGARRMLQTLVGRFPMKFTRAQWATLSNMSSKSGTFSSYLSTLRGAGLIVEEGNLFTASQEGIAYLGGDVPEPQTSEQTRKMWRGHLKAGARRMFDVLEQYYPQPLTREQLAEEAGISANSGTFSSYLSAMRTNELLDEAGGVKLSDDLYID